MAYFDYENLKFYFLLVFSMTLIVTHYILAIMFLGGCLILALIKPKNENETKSELAIISLLFLILLIRVSFEMNI